MIKRNILKKICVIFLCLIIIKIIRIYPSHNTSYISNINKGYIYLLDNNNYISRMDIVFNSSNKYEQVKEIINTLTLNSEDNILKNGFRGLIPENTKLLNIQFDNDNLILNFSEEFLNIDKSIEEKMIESIVYSITSIEEINSVTIKVNNVLLQKLPNSSKKIPEKIDRSFKINKEYNISSLFDINDITVFYPAKYDDFTYYIPVTKYLNSDKEKIEIIIEELKSSNSYNSNLISYLNNEVKLTSYEILDDSIILNFNNQLFFDLFDKNMIEKVIYTINLSISENYDNVSTVFYYIDDNFYNSYFLLRG